MPICHEILESFKAEILKSVYCTVGVEGIRLGSDCRVWGGRGTLVLFRVSGISRGG